MSFLPSRITVRIAIFFFFFGCIANFLPPLLYWLVYGGAVWWLFNKTEAGESWWSYFKLLLLVPFISFRLPLILVNIFFSLLRQWTELWSHAEACYYLLDMPIMMNLSDPLVLQKSQYCFNTHNISRSDIDGLDDFFRIAYQESNYFTRDVFTQCVRMKKAFMALDTTPASQGHFPSDMEWVDDQVELAAQCLRLVGDDNSKTIQAIRKATEAAAEDNAPHRESIKDALDTLKKFGSLKEIRCEEGEAEQACRDRRVEALFENGLITSSVLAQHYQERDAELNKTKHESQFFQYEHAVNM